MLGEYSGATITITPSSSLISSAGIFTRPPQQWIIQFSNVKLQNSYPRPRVFHKPRLVTLDLMIGSFDW